MMNSPAASPRRVEAGVSGIAREVPGSATAAPRR